MKREAIAADCHLLCECSRNFRFIYIFALKASMKCLLYDNFFTQIIDCVHRIFQEYTTFLFKHFYIAFVDIIFNFHGSRTCILVKRLILTLTIAKR